MRPFLLQLFMISFLLNFIWEITQMPLYGEMGLGIRSDYLEFLNIHWSVSIKDALMVLVVYLVISGLMKNWQWFKTFNRAWVWLWLSLPLWQGVIEYYSVYIYHRWQYGSAMPLVFGLGLSPLLQMLILPSLAIWLASERKIC